MRRRQIHEHHSPYHRLRVTEDGSIRVLRFEHNPQSSMMLDDPYETDFEYPGYFHLALAVKPEATRTLVIGLGGGSVVKRMWRDYPNMQLDVVELDAAVVKIAHKFFSLPKDERIRVIVGDGRRFLSLAEETYDVIIVDAFDDDTVPRQLITEEFIRLARERLAPDGVLAYNFIGTVSGDRSRPFRSLYRTARNVFRQVWVFPVTPNDWLVLTPQRNIILLATDVVFGSDVLLGRIEDRVGGRVTVPGFERFGDDLYELPIRSGDVPFLLDETRDGRRGRHAR